MFGRAVGVTAICAVAVHALSLPFGSDINDLTNPAVNPKARSIQIPCAKCGLLTTSADPRHELTINGRSISQVDNFELNLNFAVSADGHRVELGGEAVYPARYHSETYHHERAIQINKVSSSGVKPLQITSSSIRVESLHRVPSDGGAVVQFTFQIISVEGHHTAEVPDIVIDLLQLDSGELFIITVSARPRPAFLPSSSPSTAQGYANRCSLPGPVCRLKSMLSNAVAALRSTRLMKSVPCSYRPSWSKHLPPHFPARPQIVGPNDRARNYQHHHPEHSSSYHSQQYQRHRFFHALARGIIAVLVPVLAGITVGLLVSSLGLLTGRLIGCLWIRWARGGRSRHGRITLEDVDGDEEKFLLLADQDTEPLPLYENAPAYEEFEARSSMEHSQD